MDVSLPILMKTERDDIVFMSCLYVILGQGNVTVQKIELVFIREFFGKGVVFSADKNFSLAHTLYYFRRHGDRFHRPAENQAVDIREGVEKAFPDLRYTFRNTESMVFSRQAFSRCRRDFGIIAAENAFALDFKQSAVMVYKYHFFVVF